MLSLNITSTISHIENMKTELYGRLILNDFTKSILIELAKNPIKNDYISELINITNKIEGIDNDMTLYYKCKLSHELNIRDFNIQRKTDQMASDLKKVYETKDKNKLGAMIFEICRFDAAHL